MQSDVRSIRDGLNGKQNSFGALRLVFAAAVIVSHAFPLSGRGGDPSWGWWNGQVHIGLLAVYGFLGISGYVVTKSAARLRAGRFAWHRILRLYPAYWVALIVSAFVISPIVWASAGRDLSDFWTGENGPLGYVVKNATLWIRQWDIHDLFAPVPLGVSPSNPGLAGAVNGSLWSLSYELLCYVMIGALAAFGILSGARFMVAVVAGVFGILQIATLITSGAAVSVVPLFDDKMVTLGWVFMLGATAAVYSERIPLRHTYGVGASVVLIITLWFGGFHLIGIPAFIYATIWVATALPQWFHRIGSKNDYSYGIYLYGWPVQQVLAAAGLQHKLVIYVALSIIGATILAWGSWHGVEKWAMRLKDLSLRRTLEESPASAPAST